MKRKILGFVFAAFSAMLFFIVICLIVNGVPSGLGLDGKGIVKNICIALTGAFFFAIMAVELLRKKEVSTVDNVINYNVKERKMGFVTAVNTCIFKKYADFKGTASKSEFWWFWLSYFCIPCIVALGIASGFGFDGPKIWAAFIWVYSFAIMAIKFLRKKEMATLKDMASKSGFWWFWLSYFVFPCIALFFGKLLDYVGLAYILGLLCPYLAVCVRRLHDSGLSGWHILWCLIPTLGFFIFIYLMLRDHREKLDDER